MLTKTTLLSGITATLFLVAGPAMGQTSTLERMMEIYSPPDEYYFFEEDKKKVVDYKKDRMVRVCVGDSRHTVPLKVSYDGKTAEVGSNDCLRVEAKEIYLEPAKRLDPNWMIAADVQTEN